MNNSARRFGSAAVVLAVGLCGCTRNAETAEDWITSTAVPVRPAGSVPQLTVVTDRPSGRLAFDLSGKAPKLDDGTVIQGGLGLRYGGKRVTAAGSRNLRVQTVGELVESVVVDVEGPVEIRVLDRDSVILIGALITSGPPSAGFILEW